MLETSMSDFDMNMLCARIPFFFHRSGITFQATSSLNGSLPDFEEEDFPKVRQSSLIISSSFSGFCELNI